MVKDIRKQQIWEERKRQGLCPRCGGGRETEKHGQCQACRTAERARRERRHDEAVMAGKCPSCGALVDGKTKYCRPCIDRCKGNTSRRRGKRKEAGLCPVCGGPPDKEGRFTCKACLADRKAITDRWRKEGRCIYCGGERTSEKLVCGLCLRKLREQRRQLKDEVFAAYGGYKCACCSETTEAFLQIDHVNNDGAKHRKQIGAYGGSRLYQWLRMHNFPPGFQVLCANCNRGKALLGVCPHQLDTKGGQDGTLSKAGAGSSPVS